VKPKRKPKKAVKSAVEAAAKTVIAAPANFGLIYTNTNGGQIVIGVQGPSFTIFRNKRDAVDWLRGFARSIEDSSPSY
jgi:hypothetical protein